MSRVVIRAINNSDLINHFSLAQRDMWNDCVTEFNKHFNSKGLENHQQASTAMSSKTLDPGDAGFAQPDPTTETDRINNAGFSECTYTQVEKKKLHDIEYNANHYVHEDEVQCTMLHPIAFQGIDRNHVQGRYGSWEVLNERPTRIDEVANGTFTAAYVRNGTDNISTAHSASNGRGIRISIANSAPKDPVSGKEIWIDTADQVLKFYSGSSWVTIGAVYK